MASCASAAAAAAAAAAVSAGYKELAKEPYGILGK
jgi:hypothetical protein